MGNGTRGASAPWGFRDDAGAQGAGVRGTTTLSPQPAGAAGESEGWGWGDDHCCRVLLRSRILRATSCALEWGLDRGTGIWPGVLWTEGWGGGLGGGREHFWCSGFL